MKKIFGLFLMIGSWSLMAADEGKLNQVQFEQKTLFDTYYHSQGHKSFLESEVNEDLSTYIITSTQGKVLINYKALYLTITKTVGGGLSFSVDAPRVSYVLVLEGGLWSLTHKKESTEKYDFETAKTLVYTAIGKFLGISSN